MEERIATIEGTMVQMDKRLNHFESELGEIRNEISDLRKEMTTNFRWIIGFCLRCG